MNKHFIDLMKETALHLTGKEVKFVINEGEPLHTGGQEVAGWTCKNIFDEPTITLQYIYLESEFVKRFCHECAHVLLHLKEMGDSDGLTSSGGDLVQVEGKITPAIQKYLDQRELEAETLAEKWYQAAQSHVMGWQRNNAAALLRALLRLSRGIV